MVSEQGIWIVSLPLVHSHSCLFFSFLFLYLLLFLFLDCLLVSFGRIRLNDLLIWMMWGGVWRRKRELPSSSPSLLLKSGSRTTEPCPWLLCLLLPHTGCFFIVGRRCLWDFLMHLWDFWWFLIVSYSSSTVMVVPNAKGCMFQCFLVVDDLRSKTQLSDWV